MGLLMNLSAWWNDETLRCEGDSVDGSSSKSRAGGSPAALNVGDIEANIHDNLTPKRGRRT